MNTAKIAALYASPLFNTLLRFPSFDTTTTLTEQVILHVLREARVVSADGRRYHFDAGLLSNRLKYRNDAGERASGLFEEYCTKRQADWLLSQVPGWPDVEIGTLREGLSKQETFLVSIWGYGQENGPETLSCLRYGAQEDFEGILRGMASMQRKRRKQAKKLEAQLRAYHQQQLAEAAAEEQGRLRKGHWLGAERALTTAARIDEPGVPYMGDAEMTREQRLALPVHYWVVAGEASMTASFPEGTGIALQQVHRSRELVDGAVYLYTCEWGNGQPTMLLGRVQLAGRTRGHLLLKCDDRESAFSLPLEWSWPGLKVYRVIRYTTRNGAPVAESAAVPLHQPQLRGQRRTRRDLQAA